MSEEDESALSCPCPIYPNPYPLLSIDCKWVPRLLLPSSLSMPLLIVLILQKWIVYLLLPRLPSVLSWCVVYLSLSFLCIVLVLFPLSPPGNFLTFLHLLRETPMSNCLSVGIHPWTRNCGSWMLLKGPSNCSVNWLKSRLLLSPPDLYTSLENVRHH